MGWGKTISLVFALVFLVVLYRVFRYFLRKERAGSQRPGLTMQQAWDHWMTKLEDLAVGDRQIVEQMKSRLAESAIENVKKELFEIEKRSKEAEDPLIPLRTALMDAVDTSLLNHSLSQLKVETKKILHTQLGELYTDEVFLWGYLTRSFMCGILRWYSSLKYDDAGEDDWFTYYTQIAKERTQNVVETLQCLENGDGEVAGVRALIKKAYDEQVADQLRQYLVKAPKRTPILTPGDKKAGEKKTGEKPDQWTW